MMRPRSIKSVTRRLLHNLIGLVVVFACVRGAQARIVSIGPQDDLITASAELQPGDELVLAPGVYDLSKRWGLRLQGTVAAPIVIRAEGDESPHIRRQAEDQNIVDLDDVRHLVFRGLKFSGGSRGIRMVKASFVTIEGCEVTETGDAAITANSRGTYDGIKILRNHVHHTQGTGEGMYLGCNNNGCQFANGLIEGNYVHHTNGPNVSQGDGIEIKEGSFNNVVRDNVIHDTNYPCILTYGTVGNGPPNVVERNVLWHCGDHGIQSAANATIRNNIILSAKFDGIAMQPHQNARPKALEIVHNTILQHGGTAIRVRGAVGPVLIANNALFTNDGNAVVIHGSDAFVTLAGNVGDGAVAGTTGAVVNGALAEDFVAAHYRGEPAIDLFPSNASTLFRGAALQHEAERDFRGLPRRRLAAGAYDGAGADLPRWVLQADFKPPTTRSQSTPPIASSDASPGPDGAAAADHADGGESGPGPMDHSNDAWGGGPAHADAGPVPKPSAADLKSQALTRTRSQLSGGCAYSAVASRHESLPISCLLMLLGLWLSWYFAVKA